jgi:hypothetical protein
MTLASQNQLTKPNGSVIVALSALPQQTVENRLQKMTKRENLRVWVGLIVILLAATLYLATLDTGLRPDELIGGDLITHQYAQVQARPSNAPGYPLYTMGGLALVSTDTSHSWLGSEPSAATLQLLHAMGLAVTVGPL